MTSGHLACPGCAAPLAMRLVLKALGPKTVVVMPASCWTIIAGPWPQSSLNVPVYHTSLSGAAERNENILYCCYDNEAYMNTGIQRSSATPWGAWTTTTPAAHPESSPKKDILAIL